ncbi:Mpp10 protein-domain-containing protein [Jimgerdemannia flammicorona]|uniref:Mpp10 protein-domain-containing protein n=1 Tax=Jimgerdemannia flammicorona TaxID=994334 RepID=A0A433QSC4_9FUNG|nr:Mpp10 protein-domain-containing protein [Jimgerdemannia flammicorona]
MDVREQDQEEEQATRVSNLFTRDKNEDEADASKSEIEVLESANVGEKDWTLGGEASSKARPLNSLLEEDLEFEHVVKPISVIMQETTETLEEMIKRQILDNAFNDVEHKANPTFHLYLPSKRVELLDEKSKKSLAEIYEDDYVKETTVGRIVNEKDKALKKEHQEIDNMCQKLDILSNFHYTPKPPKPEIAVILDEDVYNKKGLVKGETETDQAERK